MPEAFYQSLSAMIRRARLSAFSAFGIVVFPILAIACCKQHITWILFFAGLFVISLIAMLYCNRKPKNSTVAPWYIYATQLDINSKLDIFTEVHDGIYIAHDQVGKIRIRALLQFEKFFQPETVSKRRNAANKKANKLLGSKNTVSIMESNHMLRINLLIYEYCNAELEKWVQNTNRTLWRAESIVNFAWIPQKALLVPNLNGPFDLSMLNRYQAAVDYVLSLAEVAR